MKWIKLFCKNGQQKASVAVWILQAVPVKGRGASEPHPHTSPVRGLQHRHLMGHRDGTRVVQVDGGGRQQALRLGGWGWGSPGWDSVPFPSVVQFSRLFQSTQSISNDSQATTLSASGGQLGDWIVELLSAVQPSTQDHLLPVGHQSVVFLRVGHAPRRAASHCGSKAQI